MKSKNQNVGISTAVGMFQSQKVILFSGYGSRRHSGEHLYLASAPVNPQVMNRFRRIGHGAHSLYAGEQCVCPSRWWFAIMLLYSIQAKSQILDFASRSRFVRQCDLCMLRH
jgi:hypothetical protein